MPVSLPIKGKGFILREFQPSDAEALAEIEFDLDVKRFLAQPAKPKVKWIKDIQQIGLDGWVIQVTDGRIAGCASLSRAKKKGYGELRIMIGKPFWGQALGTVVAKLLLEIAFKQLSAKTVVGIVHPENTASLRLLRRFKFRRRGEIREPAPSWQLGHYVYRLTKGVYSSSLHATAQEN